MNQDKTEGNKKRYRHTAEEVAGLCSVSESYVKKIRQQRVPLETPKAQQVMLVDEVLYDGSTKLLKAVENLLKTSI